MIKSATNLKLSEVCGARVLKSLMLVSALSMVGCASYSDQQKFRSPSLAIDGSRHTQNTMVIAKRTYDAVDNMLERSQVAVEKDKPLIVSTVVFVSDLEKSSAFGRLLTEQIAGRTVQLGYYVVEPKLRNNFAVMPSGEHILSRNPDVLKKSLTAQAMITGTYAAGHDSVHVNLKLLELATGRILSSADYFIPSSDWSNPDAKLLLAN